MRLATIALACFATLAASLATIGAASADEMRIGSRTTQPRGHWELCRSVPQECNARTPRTRPVAMNADIAAILRSVNDRVNRAVRPVTDFAQHGVEELWSYPTTMGDCEDYVLAKRAMLMSYGFRPGDLLITVVEQSNGEGHAVLSVRTDHGEYVLDNLDGAVRHWSQTPYRYIKRQSARHAGTWVSITSGSTRVAMR